MCKTGTAGNHQNNDCFSLILVSTDFYSTPKDFWMCQVKDYVLDKVADLIKHNLLEGDNMAHYRGDGFLILLPKVDSLTALKVADNIRRAVKKAKWPKGMGVTINAGVASYPEDGERLTELMKKVENAISQEKNK
ncbi:MAG: putative diguanylate cyclase YdaM [Pelotomaculum sp. PtaU1.Bin035]|nr:MAG: putative diguanylate cyclase YdaM [Pelotomaculum sp. PtaU1.Bin035]